PYSVFYQQVEADRVAQVTIQELTARGRFTQPFTWPPPESAAAATTQPRTSNRFTTMLPVIEDPQLLQTLREHNVIVTIQQTETSPFLLFLLNFGPILLLLGFFIWSARRAQGQMGNVFGFGRSQAREY